MSINWTTIEWDLLSREDKFVLLTFPVRTAPTEAEAWQYSMMTWAALPDEVRWGHLANLRWADILTAIHPNPTQKGPKISL